MLTAPANFTPWQNSMAAQSHMILSITDGTTTWLLSDCDMQLTDGHVWPLLLTADGIREGVDIFTRDWFTSDARFTMTNLPYHQNTSGVWTRLSEEINLILNHDAKVYLMAGSAATALSDCLLRFSGIVLEHPSYDDKVLTLRVRDKSTTFNKTIPAKTVGSIYTDCPEEVANERIPLVYGDFTFNILDPYVGNGMAKGWPTTKGIHPKFVFSDHILHAITDLWIGKVGDYPVEYVSHTLDDDDSGYGTGLGSGDYCWMHLFITGIDDADYVAGTDGVSPDYPTPTNYMNATHTGTLYATIKDWSDDGSNITGNGYWTFPEEQETAILSAMASNDDQSAGTPIEVVYKVNALLAGAAATSAIRFYKGGQVFSDTGVTFDNTERTISRTISAPAAGSKTDVFALGCRQTNGPSIGDSVTENQDMLRVYYLRMRVGWYFGRRFYRNTMITKKGQYPSEEAGFAVCQGREFGAWIDNGGRSNTFNAGEMIDEPQFIIESILRDELGLVDANIDEASFDECQDSAAQCRVNLIEAEPAFDTIKRLCEQSKFAFYWSAAGKARCILINEASPTTQRTIPFSHCAAKDADGSPAIEITKTEVIGNYINYKHTWQAEYDDYRYEEVTEDSTSQTAYGMKRFEAEYPYLSGTKADNIATFFKTLAANAHQQIELTTCGFTNADLEAGDWIELDDESWDGQVKCFGDSWAGIQFLVTEINQRHDGTQIKAIAV